jgi:hypothetical protein
VKVGDLVKDNHPNRRLNERFGVIVSESADRYVSMALNRAFKVLWRDGTIGKNVWDYDLKIVNSA